MVNPKIKITFLGTGTSGGVPMIACGCEVCVSDNLFDKRLRSSIMIETDSTRVIIDTTPDFRQQMLRHEIKEIDAIVYTHGHKDHLSGLDDVRAFNFFQKKTIPLYANKNTIHRIKKEFDYAFSEIKYIGVPELDIIEINENDTFTIGNLSFEPILVKHHLMDVLGFRIFDFVYITDANYIDELNFDKIKDCKILVLNALRKEKHLSHFTLDEAITLGQKTNAENIYLTHISHQLGKHNEVNNTLPQKFSLTYDTLSFSI